ncbi:BTAD domain-containing putative transcriptional regulator [Verrucosispora sp. WMMD573]|uniref:BTAD domain-containing putative transcriptional regulator n=1 Tax=Verrucosispora sp. WMMD573 TaxID=3015149 RepID=UPI00248CD2B6|nr:BTAD domain-containing putative transcriptional regulator [Verrucosispora sp. WMMD573]WBB53860.1 BTAD domain-containing putative transcriptional regulator [Verrucosispora sp. WMMD573]
MEKRASTAVVRTATAVLALAPLALLYQAGWFTIGELSTDRLQAWVHQPLTTGFITLLAYTSAWLLWVLLMTAVAGHTYRYLAARLRWHLTLHLPGPLQALAATLLGTTAVTTAALPATAHGHTAADTDPPAVTPPTSDDAPIRDTPPACPAPSRLGLAVTSPPTTPAVPTPETLDSQRDFTRPTTPPALVRGHTDARATDRNPARTIDVTAGDTLWDLAATHLDDATRWREIYTLNQGHPQANGYALTDPDEIHVGWTLALPARQTTPAPDSETSATSGPNASTPEATESAPPTTPPSATPAPSSSESSPLPPSTTAPSTPDDQPDEPTPVPGTDTSQDEPDDAGIALPTQGWMSLGLAAAIAAVATLLRLQRRRRARLTVAASPSVAPQPSPMPRSLAGVDMIGSRHLGTGSGDHRPATPAVPAPVGVGPDATEMSLFDLPGPGIALHGQGAVPAARAILAAVLSTNATETAVLRPVVVTTTGLLARLLPEDAPAVGLDPDGTAYDGERLVVLADTAAAITHAEEEMIGRRRLLDTFDADTITDLNARSDHAETQPPYVLLIESTTRHAARLEAVAAHRAALDLHSVILGPHDGIPTIEITAEGTVTGDGGHQVARLSTLGADDLAAVLAMLTDALARPEAGADVDDPRAETLPAAVTVEAAEPVPAQSEDAAALVRLRVLGPVTVITDAGPIATGMRSGSYTVLAVLAAHPAGRTLDQLAAALHPDVDPAAAVKRVRTDITSARRVLRAATGHDEPMFIVYDPATGRYQLDPQTVTVDLWQMLTTIDQATSSDDEATTLAALRRATELYAADFAEGHDHAWATDYATSYRHQILTAHARIAEILEPDHPDQAVAALERAAGLDPVNEELYQRIMRIHGRQRRPDAVRRTLRRLEERLADLGDAEPSQATRRVAERQLRPITPVSGARP